jgi:hypothetical protein
VSYEFGQLSRHLVRHLAVCDQRHATYVSEFHGARCRRCGGQLRGAESYRTIEVCCDSLGCGNDVSVYVDFDVASQKRKFHCAAHLEPAS